MNLITPPPAPRPWKAQESWPTTTGVRYFRRIVDADGNTILDVGTAGKEMRATEEFVEYLLNAPEHIAQLENRIAMLEAMHPEDI